MFLLIFCSFAWNSGWFFTHWVPSTAPVFAYAKCDRRTLSLTYIQYSPAQFDFENTRKSGHLAFIAYEKTSQSILPNYQWVCPPLLLITSWICFGMLSTHLWIFSRVIASHSFITVCLIFSIRTGRGSQACRWFLRMFHIFSIGYWDLGRTQVNPVLKWDDSSWTSW